MASSSAQPPRPGGATPRDPRMLALAYAGGALQGFAFSVVAAIAATLTGPLYGLSAGAYGALFVPQTVGAVVGALLSPRVAERYGALVAARVGVACNVAGLAALLASLADPRRAYPLLLLDTAAMGLGFGLLNAAANTLAQRFAANPDRSVTLVNVLTGLGTALSPSIVGALDGSAALRAAGGWRLLPIGLTCAFLALAAATCLPRLPRARQAAADGADRADGGVPTRLRLFAAAAALYGACEGAFGNWATAFLQERGVSPGLAELGLTGFWLALTATRILGAAAPRLLPLRTAVPYAAAAAAAVLAALPTLRGDAALVAGFLAGGVGCGVMFQYLIANALDAMPTIGDRVSGLMIGGLMVGEGVGSFAVGALRGPIGLSGAYRLAAAVAVALAFVSAAALKTPPDAADAASAAR